MNADRLTACLRFLQGMPSITPWDERQEEHYGLVLSRLDDDLARQALEHCALFSLTGEVKYAGWRPTTAQLLSVAVKMASPYPDEHQTWQEMIVQAQLLGENARVHPERPAIRLPGPPAFTHRIVGEVVGKMGGWKAICSGEATYYEGMKKQVREIHAQEVAQWEQLVFGQLCLPLEHRNPCYFPVYVPFVAPAGFRGVTETEVVMIEAGNQVSGEVPEFVKQIASGKGLE